MSPEGTGSGDGGTGGGTGGPVHELDRDRLLERLGLEFDDPALLDEALSHRSAGGRHYERLEFLGDSLLSFVVSAELFRLRPGADEGALSRLRASLVRESALAAVAREHELGRHLVLGTGERRSGGFARDSILADVVESLIGAVHVDRGFEAARALVLRLFAARLADLPEAESLKDPKTRLQEILQSRGLERPVYAVVEESGRAHERRFTVRCTLDAIGATVRATASSRRKAEQAAAALLIERAAALPE